MTVPFAYAAPVMAQTDVEIVFIVDESGSMGGEHLFLQTFVPSLDTQLVNAGATSTAYGLVGFGRSSPAAHQLLVGGGDFGTAAEFTTAAGGLVTTGSTEDGYEAIDFAFNNLAFTAGAQRIYVIVTDEDRDIIDGALTRASTLALLQGNNITLHGILNQTIETAGGVSAVGADGDTIFTDTNNDGTPEEVAEAPQFPAEFGSTEVDYTTLILDVNGCVADLNLLRDGGTNADAFAAALATCLIATVVTPPPPNVPVPFVMPMQMAARLFTNTHFSDLQLRLTGRLHGTDSGPSGADQADLAQAGLAQAGLTEQSSTDGQSGLAEAAMGLGQMMSFFQTGELPRGAVTQMNLGPEHDVVSFGPVRAFFNVTGRHTDVDRIGNQLAFNQRSMSGTVGVDLDVAPGALIGVAVGLSKADADAKPDASEVDSKMLSGFVYGATRLGEHAYISGAASYSRLDYDTRRDNTAGIAIGSTDGHAYGARAEAGYVIPISDHISVTPAAGLNYLKLHVDEYTETGPGAATISKQDYGILTLNAKLKIAGNFELEDDETSIVPVLTLGVNYEVDNPNEIITTTLAGTAAQFNIIAPDELSFTINPGIAILAPEQGMTARLDYSATVSEDHVDHSVTLRARMAMN